ncbi:wd40 repeat-like protein [Alternaria burnsii]|uniref:Wd40 repeat-like protein n=1 Tax=Alternaria burnsii TaxID=1187904 RepID=A0A8H7EJY6_9PLEO|nr:wd40 repeat-like protein [Alternaria burnsii]KAF7678517.1 wd40 repeat-like protein [Alternaria burnsii]
MADTLPKIKVTDPSVAGRSAFQIQENGSSTTVDGMPYITPIALSHHTENSKMLTPGFIGPLSNKKLVAKLRSPTSPSAQPTADLQNGYVGDGTRLSETPIDPLSQQILQRTNTSPAVQKLRSQNTEPLLSQSPTSPNDVNADKKLSGETPRDASGGKADKKKVSFLSRFIGGNKKKSSTLDGASENGSEADDLRLEGMDAQLYVDNFSFSPKVPHPPAYIKVRTKFKKEKEFDRVFLAQELRSGSDKKSPPAAGSNPAPQSGSAATQNPIWAVEFSKDGRYLAVGGQDRVIRVWAVIESSEGRRAHENADNGEAKYLSAPVFHQKPVREYQGHTSTILDLSWSKNNFLLSSSMDKTVRLWHVSRDENLCTFKHSDFVPSIQFHPTDDRFFLAGSLDAKLRLWSIPDKSVAFSVTVPDMITSVAFTPDGKTCIAGTLGGLCMFYDTEGLKWQAQLHVKSTRGQNAKGSKITGIQAAYWPPGSESGEIKLLISSNDSRLRIYNMKDKALEMKLRGHENNCSQIRATFADSSGHIICGSEDRKTYIWSTTATAEGEKRNQRPVEMFEAHNSITTCTVIAPVHTRQLLSASEDPIFDLCNPPPVTLVSKAESVISSRAPTEVGSTHPTPAPTDTHFKKAAGSPAYIERSAHRGGNIIVTADYTGALKVFRQDCAHQKRIRMSEQWDTASMKRTSGIGRPSSIISRTSRSRRDSVSTQPPNDRIMTWRQGISHGSLDSTNSLPRRSASPRKSLAAMSFHSTPHESPVLQPTKTNDTFDTKPTGTPKTSVSIDRTTTSLRSTSYSEASSPLKEQPTAVADDEAARRSRNPLAVYNGQSWLFWTNRDKSALTAGNVRDEERPELLGRMSTISQISRLTDERSDEGRENGT